MDKVDVSDRFWSKVDMSGDCWLWTASKHIHGYGWFSLDGVTTLAHRMSYMLIFGDIPDSMNVCHMCDTPSCVNPKHLFLGTQQTNVQDMYAKGRRDIGENHPKSKLSNKQVKEIRAKYIPRKVSLRQLAKEYDVTHRLIETIIKYKTRKDI